ncbi:MAG: hypothetical protein JW850_16615 [Thermoflexales bacterium]|nr:hypothetical protein [Thermoflexales bacterium]
MKDEGTQQGMPGKPKKWNPVSIAKGIFLLIIVVGLFVVRPVHGQNWDMVVLGSASISIVALFLTVKGQEYLAHSAAFGVTFGLARITESSTLASFFYVLSMINTFFMFFGFAQRLKSNLASTAIGGVIIWVCTITFGLGVPICVIFTLVMAARGEAVGQLAVLTSAPAGGLFGLLIPDPALPPRKL